jgi:hypothetical protein
MIGDTQHRPGPHRLAFSARITTARLRVRALVLLSAPDSSPSPRACGRRRPDRSIRAVPRLSDGGVSGSSGGSRRGRQRRRSEQPCRRAGHQRRRRGQQAVIPHSPFLLPDTRISSLVSIMDGGFCFVRCAAVSFCFALCDWPVRGRGPPVTMNRGNNHTHKKINRGRLTSTYHDERFFFFKG